MFKKTMLGIMVLSIITPFSTLAHIAENATQFVITVGAAIGMGKICYDGAQYVMPLIQNRLASKKITQPAMPASRIGVLRLHGDVGRTMVNDNIGKLMQLRKDPSIKGVLVSLESWGGSFGYSYVLYQELKELAKVKPVVIFTAEGCTSGGYCIACGADWIVISPVACTGSIGVIQWKTTFINTINKGKIDNEEGDVKVDILQSGKYKAAFDAHKPFTDEMRAYFQEQLDKQYEFFCKLVAQERKLELEDKEQWAEGQAFLGEKALELGLIDQIGSLTDAIAKLHAFIYERNLTITPGKELDLLLV